MDKPEKPLSSVVSEEELRYPEAPLRREGRLRVGEAPGVPHEIQWWEHGNPDGEPVFFLHGGPGGGCSPKCTRFFDPERYRIVLFNQRGTEGNRPSVTEAPELALQDNTIADLVADIQRLREHLGLRPEQRMHVFGGSWGSTLALAYAIEYPETVETLVLRGVFLGRPQDLACLYQGNAAEYELDPDSYPVPGAYICFPETWRRYVETIPPGAKRRNMIGAYREIFGRYSGVLAALAKLPAAARRTPGQADDYQRLTAEEAAVEQAAITWAVWEGSASNLITNRDELGKFERPEFAVCFAMIEAHFFRTGQVFPQGAENWILERVARMAHLPIHIVHGRYDQVCPALQAEALRLALSRAGAEARLSFTAAGHSGWERENYLALVEIMDHLPPMGRGAAV